MIQKMKEFFQKEMVLCIAAVCAVLTMFLVPPDREYLHYIDFRVLCLLLCLMAVVAGFRSVGTFQWITGQLLRRINNGRILGVALVLMPFFSSMLVTNDVALIVFIPFTLSLLAELGCGRTIIPVIVLQTIAANLGSMATPVGNPQNLYLYAAYNMHPTDFFGVTLPLTLVSLVVLAVTAHPVMPRKLPFRQTENVGISSPGKLLIYGGLFVLCILTVFRVISYPVATAVVVGIIFFMDRRILKEIDFMLLLTFVCFFVISENLGRVEGIRNFLQTLLAYNTLFTAIGTSQVISNVPAAVLLSGFTDQWREMLAGVNIGGLGTPIASLASLITLKFYMNWPSAKTGKFLAVFTVANVIGLVVLVLFCRVLFI